MLRKLFLMGLLYAAVSLTAGLATFLPFSSAFAEGMRIASIENSMEPILMAMRAPLIIFTIVYIVIAALFWYAPVLVAGTACD